MTETSLESVFSPLEIKTRKRLHLSKNSSVNTFLEMLSAKNTDICFFRLVNASSARLISAPRAPVTSTFRKETKRRYSMPSLTLVR